MHKMLGFLVLAVLAAGTNAATPCVCKFMLYSQFNCVGTPIKTPTPLNFSAPPGTCKSGAIFNKQCQLTIYNESSSCNDGPKIPLPENGCTEVPQNKPNQRVKSFKTFDCGTGPIAPSAPLTTCDCGIYQYNVSNCKGKPIGKGLEIKGKIGQCLGRGAEFAANCGLEIYKNSNCTGRLNTVLPDDGCTNYNTSVGFQASFYTKCHGGNTPPPPPAPSTCKCYIGTHAQYNCTGPIGSKVPLTGKVNTCNRNVRFDANCNPTLYAQSGCRSPIITLPPAGCSNIPAKFSNPNIKSVSAYGCGVAVDEEGPEIMGEFLTGKYDWTFDNEFEFSMMEE